MINLAPNHKLGLLVKNPILLAGGTIGYGEALAPGLHTALLGGVVVGPLALNSRGGAEPPRLAEVNGGFVLATGLQNRGISAVIKQFARHWSRLGTPVIAQLAEGQPSALTKIATHLAEQPDVSALELLPPPHVTLEALCGLIQAVAQTADLPIWIKLPLDRAVELAPGAVAAGAVGLVIGQPPAGTAFRPLAAGHPPQAVSGGLYGLPVFVPMLTTLLAVAQQRLPAALIACGGIHTLAQARQVLAAGAQALQIDSALWIEPGLPERLVAGLPI